MEAIDNNYLLIGILAAILIICLFMHKHHFMSQTGGAANFVPATPWVEAPEYPSPYRTSQYYLGGSTKCFSCEKDLVRRGRPPYLARPSSCFDCESQARMQLGETGAQFGQPNKCFSCEQDPNPYRRPHNFAHRTDAPSTSFGRADGQAFDDHLQSPSVGLTKGFGRAEGLDAHEADTQNPIDYRVQ